MSFSLKELVSVPLNIFASEKSVNGLKPLVALLYEYTIIPNFSQIKLLDAIINEEGQREDIVEVSLPKDKKKYRFMCSGGGTGNDTCSVETSDGNDVGHSRLGLEDEDEKDTIWIDSAAISNEYQGKGICSIMLIINLYYYLQSLYNKGKNLPTKIEVRIVSFTPVAAEACYYTAAEALGFSGGGSRDDRAYQNKIAKIFLDYEMTPWNVHITEAARREEINEYTRKLNAFHNEDENGEEIFKPYSEVVMFEKKDGWEDNTDEDSSMSDDGSEDNTDEDSSMSDDGSED